MWWYRVTFQAGFALGKARTVATYQCPGWAVPEEDPPFSDIPLIMQYRYVSAHSPELAAAEVETEYARWYVTQGERYVLES